MHTSPIATLPTISIVEAVFNRNRVGDHWESAEDECKSKQESSFDDDEELSETVDRVLLCAYGDRSSGRPHQQKFNAGSGTYSITAPRKKKARRRCRKAADVMDMSSLLNLCARAIIVGDYTSVNEHVAEIRKHSSPYGSGTERFAHYFVEAAEARLNGQGFGSYRRIAFQKIPIADLLKQYRLFSLTPYIKIPQDFAFYHIMNVAERASTLHIIDFGIMHGFQWPSFIKAISLRFGNVQKLRITGIESPESGFRPSRCAEGAGRRLMKYCHRFNVPFEYHALVRDWQMIKAEDFEIRNDEAIAVNCFYKFRHTSDEGEVNESPRDEIFRLIRVINPHIFVYAIINRCFSGSFFPSRLREAMFCFSSEFDMLESITTDDISCSDRLEYERNCCSDEMMNVLACEGRERIERPETYQRWHVRTVAAGFQPMPLNRDLVLGFADGIKSKYHEDFSAHEKDPWLLMAWKGRITTAVSCWTPAYAPPGVHHKKICFESRICGST